MGSECVCSKLLTKKFNYLLVTDVSRCRQAKHDSYWLKAGYHMIADDRESQIVDRIKFCDGLRSYGNPLLRSFAIACDRLRSCDHMETKVLRSAIETYPIILILTQMIQNLLATKPECSFMFVTVLSETRSSLSSVWKAPNFCLFMNIFRTQADDAVASGLKEEVNLLAAKFPPRCPLCCLLKRFCREHNACVHLTILLTEMYGCSRLCDRLRGSSAIIWKQVSLRSSAIVCDHMETSLKIGNLKTSELCSDESIF